MSKSHTSSSCIQEKPQETGPLTVDYDLKNIVKFVYFLPCSYVVKGRLLTKKFYYRRAVIVEEQLLSREVYCQDL